MKPIDLTQGDDAGEPVTDYVSPILAIDSRETFVAGQIVAQRYEILGLIGQGGCGTVYKVKQTVTRQVLALKTLNPTSVSKLTLLRLEKEAEAVGKLEHPNLVGAVDFGTIDGVRPYLAMEYAEGPTLAEYLKQKGRISPETAIRIFVPICMGLSYAHDLGVIHRDIKPSNIILKMEGRNSDVFVPMIVDFGIAKLQFSESNSPALTKTGEVFGTPLYMSPEQCLGAGTDHRSDIYSLGCVMFEALTGAPPYPGNNAIELLMQHSNATIPTLKEASLGLTFSPQIEQIINRMLAKQPNERYQSLQDVVRDLTSQSAIKTRASLAAATRARESRENYALWAALSVLVILLSGVCGFALANLNRPKSVSAPTHLIFTGAENAPAKIPAHSSIYFRTSDTGPRLYHLPTTGLGEFYYYDAKHHLFCVNASGDVMIPEDAKLVLRPNGATLYSTAYWGQFRSDDLAGVDLKSESKFEAEYVESVVYAAAMQENLIYLGLTGNEFFNRPFSILGTLNNLRWLRMRGVRIKSNLVTGSDMASLPNLRKLSVLRLEKFVAPGPMLRELAHGSQLRRLGLINGSLTGEDLHQITQIPHLETLYLSDVKIPQEISLFKILSAAPNLRILGLYNVTVPAKFANDAADLAKLQRLSVGAALGQSLENIKPKPNWTFTSNEAIFDNSLFDPRTEDPALSKLW